MTETSAPAVANEGGGSELRREADYVAMLYARLDQQRAKLAQQLDEVRLATGRGTHQWRTERDALAYHLERSLAALSIGDLPLCFGRLDLDDGSRLHVGRVGIGGDGEEPLLMDWRAPVASLFYRATPGTPSGVIRRRHLLTKGREVIAIDDEVFDLDAVPDAELADLHGDAALLAAVQRSRGQHMRDIVATIQAEQDAVIRSELPGVLVVQGGPGTGKTAVALHRAAYLLYTYRERLSDAGVLVVGPNPVFLRYIEQVLPALGETGAVLSTVQTLYPGIRPTRREAGPIGALKGDERMVTLLRQAVADRERLPPEDVTIPFERAQLRLTREMCARARQRARRSGRPHNDARSIVQAVLVEQLLNQIRALPNDGDATDLSPEALSEMRASLRRARPFRALMERIWPVLSAEQLLNDLFGTPALLRSAGRELSEEERALLVRERVPLAKGVDWSAEDVPLLDEAAELLGVVPNPAAARLERARRAERQRDLDFANSVLSSLQIDMPINAERFSERFGESSGETVAARAARDRTWKFGHVIVDEAQELSPMAWRMVIRRNPNHSMTVVGDLAQSSGGWTPSWSSVLDRVAPGHWREAVLSVTYRTPSEIIELTRPLLAAIAPDIEPPQAIRASGEAPSERKVAADDLVGEAVALVREDFARFPEGTLAVIVPAALAAPFAAVFAEALPELFDGRGPLHSRGSVLAVNDAKGLEFDAVVLVEPAIVVADGQRGLSDLYVALTRATQRLSVLHSGELPAVLEEGFARLED